MTNTNGQSPFLSVNMYLGETEEYKEELTLEKLERNLSESDNLLLLIKENKKSSNLFCINYFW